MLALSFLGLLATAAISAASSAYVVKESLPAIPRGWTRTARAPADHVLNLHIGLVQPGFGELEQALREVSDPSHARYGMHLSKEEVEAMVRPHPSSLELVDAWLLSHSIPLSALTRSPAQDWLSLSLPVSLAEQLLSTQYHIYAHSPSGASLIRTTHWSLPADLHAHVDVVQPTTSFSRARAHRSTLEGFFLEPPTAPVPDACNRTITPACLRDIYNVGNYTPSVASGSKLGITGYLGENANMNDTAHFFASYVPAAAAADFIFSVELINNGTNSQNESLAGGEANLDVQYAGGLSFPIPNTFYSTGGSPPYTPDGQTTTDTNEPYADFLAYILAKSDEELPTTLSTSYGDDEQTVPLSYAVRVCNSFAQLGARGTSVIFSSGDGGVGDGTGPGKATVCYSNDGKNTSMFLPGFPSSCPYVTSVGGTYLEGPERAVPFSGGGFSNYFARPFFQDIAVPGYLNQLGATYAGLYNANGRGIPDVSAQGNNFTINRNGSFGLVAGTSCACPTFAGIISLVNDHLMSNGRRPLGWLNPWLYSFGQFGLTDITIGNNPGCGTEGFNATLGWDPITGLGTPNFGKLKEIAWTL